MTACVRSILALTGDFETGPRETVDCYADYRTWVESVRSGEYLSYYERQFSARLP